MDHICSASSSTQVGDKAQILQVPMTICGCEETINEFEMLTRDAGHVQQDTLRKILEVNADAEYLKHFSLGRRTDAKSFKSCIPLCVHSDMESYIKRIADGDNSHVLTGKPITSLSVRSSLNTLLSLSRLLVYDVGIIWTWMLLSSCFSSGTTQGKPKFLPFNDELLETTIQIFRTSFAFRNRWGTSFAIYDMLLLL